MKIIFLIVLVLSIWNETNARCVKKSDSSSSSEECSPRHFPEPKPRKIHYIHHKDHDEGCDCLKYHDIVVQKPKKDEQSAEKLRDFEYNVEVPNKKIENEKEVTRYLFDVRVEQPATTSTDAPSASYDYKLQEAAKLSKEDQRNHIRYIFDTRVEKPIKPCKERPWQGLVTQVDAVLEPKSRSRSCSNPDHTPGNCNCGCQNPQHTPRTCNCHKDLLNLPVFLRF